MDLKYTSQNSLNMFIFTSHLSCNPLPMQSSIIWPHTPEVPFLQWYRQIAFDTNTAWKHKALMQKYKETSHGNTATPYSAILKPYGQRTKLTIYYVYVKKLLVKDNLISFLRYHHLKPTTIYGKQSAKPADRQHLMQNLNKTRGNACFERL